MMDDDRREELRTLLPWYVHGGLDDGERRAVERALETDVALRDELDSLKRLAFMVSEQPAADPSPDLWDRIRRRTVVPAAGRWRWVAWAFGALLALALVFGLWGALQPGVELQWSVAEGNPIGFRIYRARAEADSYALLEEIPAEPASRQYRYVDRGFWPGRVYVYRVEAIDPRGGSAFSQTVMTDTLQIALLQAAILLTGLLAGYAGRMLAARRLAH